MNLIRDPYFVFLIIPITLLFGMTTWIRTGEIWNGDWALLDWRWVEDTLPFPGYWSHDPIIPEAHRAFGTDGAMTAWMAPLSTVAAILQVSVNKTGTASRFFFMLTPIVIGPLCAYPLYRLYVGRNVFAVIGALLFAWSPFTIVGTHGGQLLQGAAITCIPMVMCNWCIFVGDTTRGRNLLPLICSIAMQSICDPRFVYLTFLPIGIHAVFSANTLAHAFKSLAWAALLFTVSGSIFQGPWLVGMLMGGSERALPDGYRSIDQVTQLSHVSLYESLTLWHEYFPSQLFVRNPPWLVFQLWGLIFFLGIIVTTTRYKYNKQILPMSICLVASAFLSKGSNAPISDAYGWMFVNVPGMDAFRSATKWTAICNMAGIALFVVFLRDEFKSLTLKNALFWKGLTTVTIICGIIVAWLAPMSIVLRGDDFRGGTLLPRERSVEQLKLSKLIQSGGGPVRALVVPWGDEGIEKSSNFQLVTLFHSIGNSWEPYVPHGDTMEELLEKTMMTPIFPMLLNAANIHWLIVPHDPNGIVFVRENAENTSQAPGFKKMVSTVIRATGVLPMTEYKEHAVFEFPPPAGPVFAVRELRIGSRSDARELRLRSPSDRGTEASPVDEVLEWAFPQKEADDISVNMTKINSSRYIGSVNFQSQGWIVLSEQFASGWRSYAIPDGQSESAPEAWLRVVPGMKGAWWWIAPSAAKDVARWELPDHRRVNGFMQAWHVVVPGSYRVVLEYFPQRAYEAGWLVTIGALSSVAVGSLAWAGRRGWSWLRGRSR